MTDTFISEHVDEVLCELGWETPAGTADQWAVMFQLLPALSSQRLVFGMVSGTLRIGHGPPETRRFEQWPIRADGDVQALRTRVDAFGDLPWPLELRLDCEPLVWLTDDHVNVIDHDDPDLVSLGRERVSLRKASDVPFSVPGMHPWRLCHNPVPLLFLEVASGTPRFASSMGFEVCSKCDLWRPTRLDGEPNDPHGEVNATVLARSVGEIAAATGALAARG